jgi:CHAD domain-containing protein
MRTGRERAGSKSDATADVLKHLADSLQSQWRRYRKRLKQCQERFSEDAVHESRVETRRLLATVELLGAFIAEKHIKKARRALKCHLDTFDQLRDTQVQLSYVSRLTRGFPLARIFHRWLQKREVRFTRETRKAVRHIKTSRLGGRIAAFRNEINRLRRQTPRDQAFAMTLKAIDGAFGRVTHCSRRAKADDTATIHRTRIAFKRFRYMIDALSPVLPAITDEHRHALRGYQSMMGDIQDVEVLLAALNKFIRNEEIDRRSARRLLEELQRRRGWLVRVYLNAAGKLRHLWPLPESGIANRLREAK